MEAHQIGRPVPAATAQRGTPTGSPGHITVHRARHSVRTAYEFSETLEHDCYELRVALRRERLSLTCNGQTLHKGLILPGMMRLLSPGEEVRGVLYTPADSVAFQIPGAHLRTALQTVSPNHRPGKVSYVNALLQPNNHTEQLGRLALHAESFDPLHAQLLFDGVVQALLACLLHHHRQRQTQRVSKRFTPAEMTQVIDFAEEHFEEPLTLRAWARVMNLAAPEFTRRFRLTFGNSPYSWFIGRRIERAKELLCSTAQPICGVALKLGFSSQSHFTDTFRCRTGISPARWRQQQGLQTARKQ